MRILLDEIVCDVVVDSVGEAIAAAATRAEKQGRMIVEVIVDGEVWESDRIDPEHSAATAKEICLTSADPVELVSQTFQDASRALTEANQLQVSAAELLQCDQTAQAMGKLNDAFSIWSSVQQAVSMGMQLAGVDDQEALISTPGMGNESQSINATIEKLNEQLRGIRAALECKDTVALADTLLYDLPEVVRQWQDLLEDLDAHVRSRTGDHELDPEYSEDA